MTHAVLELEQDGLSHQVIVPSFPNSNISLVQSGASVLPGSHIDFTICDWIDCMWRDMAKVRTPQLLSHSKQN